MYIYSQLHFVSMFLGGGRGGQISKTSSLATHMSNNSSMILITNDEEIRDAHNTNNDNSSSDNDN